MRTFLPNLNWTVAGRTATSLSLAIGLLFLVAGIFSYQDARQQSLTSALKRLDRYNLEVVREQEGRFARIVAAHSHASELLIGDLDAAGWTSAADLDRLFPARGDGTRRSADGLFDGAATPFGFVRGIGGFVGQEPTPVERTRLLAATRAIHAIGEGARPDLKSMSYYTPNNTLVMYAPDRPDKLLYYRREAPASLDFRGREFLEITLPAFNPGRVTRCTSLQPILYDTTGKTWTTGCMTPIYLGGQYVGAWGTSLLLDDLLRSSHFGGLSAADVILVSREGRLILHPDFTRQNSQATERFLDLSRATDSRLKELWSFLKQHPQGHFLGYVPTLESYVSLRRIDTPGWYALTVQSRDVVEKDVWRVLARVAATALLSMVLASALVFFLVRRQVGEPLRRLAARSAALSDSFARVVDAPELIEEGRHDEVKQMELHFSAMFDQVVSARDILEERVRERTEELERANEELRSLADRDPLTGLANRRKLAAEFRRISPYGAATRAGSLLLFDVDHFKAINDQHGHEAGDQVLVSLAKTAATLMRNGDTLARVGGEEFAVLLPDVPAESGFQVADRLRRTLSECRVRVQSSTVSFTISVGVARIQPDDTLQDVYGRADAALYLAKRSGRNRVERAACASWDVMLTTADLPQVRQEDGCDLTGAVVLHTGSGR